MSEQQTNRRWLVELRPDVFDTVSADNVVVTHGGALMFFNGLMGSLPVLIMAAGSWLTVCEEEA